MISKPSFRPMAPGEESPVCELAMRVFEELVAPGLSAAGVEEFARYANADALADRLRDNHFVLVAEAAGVIVGLIEARECNHISMLFVSSSARGQGVGAELVRRAIEVCRSHDSSVSNITYIPLRELHGSIASWVFVSGAASRSSMEFVSCPCRCVCIRKELIVSGVRLAVGKSVEYPIAHIRSAEIRDGALVLTSDEGKPVFDNVKVNGENVTRDLSTGDAAKFVNAFRAVKSRR